MYTHKKQDLLNSLVESNLHVMIVGPAGSGKSHSASIAARKKEIKFYCQSVGSQTTQAHLMGFIDAGGVYRATAFRQAYEMGGVFLLDEIDAGNANVLTCLNSALANDICSFPDAMIRKHKDFICVATANTYGLGANRQYVGRNQLDAASLDRFSVVDWEYDEKLELKLAKLSSFAKIIQLIRRNANQMGVKIIVSPRSSINGSTLMIDNQQISLLQTLDIVLFKGAVDEETKKRLLMNLTDEMKKSLEEERKQQKKKEQEEQEQKGKGKEQEEQKPKKKNTMSPEGRAKLAENARKAAKARMDQRKQKEEKNLQVSQELKDMQKQDMQKQDIKAPVPEQEIGGGGLVR